MHDESALPHYSNTGIRVMFAAMVKDEMENIATVTHELAYSGSDVIMKSRLYASFRLRQLPENTLQPLWSESMPTASALRPAIT